MKSALLQLNSGDTPLENLAQTQALISEAAAQGTGFVLTPEVTNCVSASREHQHKVLQPEQQDVTLKALRRQASELRIWLLIGSLALKSDHPDDRFVNRSFLIDPNGNVVARYDKIHMFDVKVSETETYKESSGYRPGEQAVTASTSFAKVGLTICYDVRFPALYRALAQSGAEVFTVPSAFSPMTGVAHWETLLRARAIETGSYVLAPAQTGTHTAQVGRQRSTYGHSLAIGPWGDVLTDAGPLPGVVYVFLDTNEVAKARMKIPAWRNKRPFTGPL